MHVPKELAFIEPSQDVEIERMDNTLVIRPIERRTLAGLAEALALFPPTFMAEGRDFHEERDRDWVTGQSFGGTV